MKGGGVGYIQPTPDMFPSVDELHELTMGCGALPCAAWLDGTLEGEQAMDELLGLLIGKGVVALNIVPDRNWNIPDPELRRLKVQNLQSWRRCVRPLSMGRISSMGTPFCGEPWGLATRASGRVRISSRGVTATGSTLGWAIWCHQGRPGWLS
jgi:hypothetical protein